MARKGKSSRVVKEKFAEARRNDNTVPHPLNKKQELYIRYIKEKELVLATGLPGTSKSMYAVAIASSWYKNNQINKIVFCRPAVSNSKSLGYFPGTAIEKMEMWLMPVISLLKKHLGPAMLEIALKRGDIIFLPLETLKGFSAEDCVFIVDEAEDISIDEAKKIVTRQGEGCKMILSGDVSQSELKEKSGLAYLINIAKKYNIPGVGIIDFNEIDDIVRSEQCKQWTLAFTKHYGGNADR